MVTIIYDHPISTFHILNIAGDFNEWVIVPMTKSQQKGRWEYRLSDEVIHREKRNKIHFKFIDPDGNWFTDNNYPKELDNEGNENNVKLLSGKEFESMNSKSFVKDFLENPTPESPMPSLRASAEISSELPHLNEIRRSESPVLVGYSDASSDSERLTRRHVFDGSPSTSVSETHVFVSPNGSITSFEGEPDTQILQKIPVHKTTVSWWAAFIAFFQRMLRSIFG